MSNIFHCKIPPKFTPIGIYDLTIYHLATLAVDAIKCSLTGLFVDLVFFERFGRMKVKPPIRPIDKWEE
jgi:hypothetical protein